MNNYSKDINSVLNKFRVELNADRALIALFHQLNFDSNDMVFTVMLEDLSKGTNTIYPTVKNIPRNIIDLEFKNDLDSIVVGVYSPLLPYSCVKHLEAINSKAIINLLLKLNNYYWGILSFQFKEIPIFINLNGSISSDLNNQLLNYKEIIYTIVSDYINTYYGK